MDCTGAHVCNKCTQEKERLKKETEAAQAKFKIAYVDGRAEPVGGWSASGTTASGTCSCGVARSYVWNEIVFTRGAAAHR
jgi:hypothetical protein